MPAGVAGNDQHQLVTVHLPEDRVLRAESAQFGVARFGKTDDVGARGIEIRQGFRKAGEAARGLHQLGCLPPLVSVDDHGEHSLLPLWIDRSVKLPGVFEPAKKPALGGGDVFQAFQNRPAPLRRPRARPGFIDAFDRGMQILAALLERFDDFDLLFGCHQMESTRSP